MEVSTFLDMVIGKTLEATVQSPTLHRAFWLTGMRSSREARDLFTPILHSIRSAAMIAGLLVEHFPQCLWNKEDMVTLTQPHDL